MTTNPYPPGSELATIWQLGYEERDSAFGMTYDDNPESPRSRAYDEGRTVGEREGTYTTKSGRVLTNADFEALADEAEKGYDVSHLLHLPKERES